MKSFKNFVVFAVLMMMGMAGAHAQGENGNDGITEIAETKDGKKVRMWDLKIEESNGDASFVINIDNAKAGDLWQWCRMWLAENVKNYNQIKQIEDKQEGMLMVNCTLPLKVEGKHKGSTAELSRWVGSQTWKMTIKCKDERFRVQLTEYKTSWKVSAKSSRFGWMELLTRKDLNFNETVFNIDKELFMPEYNNSINFVIKSLGEYIGKKAGENDDDF